MMCRLAPTLGARHGRHVSAGKQKSIQVSGGAAESIGVNDADSSTHHVGKIVAESYFSRGGIARDVLMSTCKLKW